MTLPAKTPTLTTADEKRSVGEGLFNKCQGCGSMLTAADLQLNWHVCPSCGFHHTMEHGRWRELLLDDGTLLPWEEHVQPADPLQFIDQKPYTDRLLKAQASAQASESVEVGQGKIFGRQVAYGSYVFGFMAGTMGSVAGERIVRLFERATAKRLPVILLHASGGARMQEGILSLMQMAKTVAALGRFRACRQPYISILMHPTTGGVAASTALLGDVNIAEPNALIGFAGPRVIENTLRTTLPEGFQRSDFLLSHGMVDTIVPRVEMKATLNTLLNHLCRELK
ncbi:MAG: acetyl-CoA carboxylase, carboxyltransferase subunit beta [Polyangiaceae bacterium]|nr:acetyl-CoA carboxylase, carboxyltransferase subunit beta [Polyangiaceae bacterium]